MKEPTFVPVILSRTEIQVMLDNVANLKVKAIITLMYSAGLRLTECSLLKIHDFDKDRMLIHIKIQKVVKNDMHTFQKQLKRFFDGTLLQTQARFNSEEISEPTAFNRK